jgi:hypothetical protein
MQCRSLRWHSPVFDRLMFHPGAASDVDHHTGQARLSYRRAAELFKAAAGGRLEDAKAASSDIS